jgi:hypothetical protein
VLVGGLEDDGDLAVEDVVLGEELGLAPKSLGVVRPGGRAVDSERMRLISQKDGRRVTLKEFPPFTCSTIPVCGAPLSLPKASVGTTSALMSGLTEALDSSAFLFQRPFPEDSAAFSKLLSSSSSGQRARSLLGLRSLAQPLARMSLATFSLSRNTTPYSFFGALFSIT